MSNGDAEDTMDRAARLADSMEFRVASEMKLTRLEQTSESMRRWLFVIIALVGLNWLHDLGATVEMLDWWDGREEGFMSSELEHEVTVLMPFVLALITIIWGRRRDKRARRANGEDC